jgi:hypothetical protein
VWLGKRKARDTCAKKAALIHFPDIIKALGISEPVNISESDYDNLFVVVLGEKPYLIRLHYR